MTSDQARSSFAEPLDRERTAAEWTLRHQQGLAPEEKKELDHWLRSDVSHAELFAEMNETSQYLDRLCGRSVAPEVIPFRPSVSAQTVRRRAWFAPAVLATAAAVALAAVWTFQRQPANPAAPYTVQLATAVGGQRESKLPDGSVLHLNTDSAAVVNYSATERRIRLTRGEAHFVVAPNKNRPFLVETGAVTVRAVGTAFMVHARSHAVDVWVTEGQVRLDEAVENNPAPGKATSTANSSSAQPRAPLVAAGQHAVIPIDSEATGTTALAAVSITQVTAEEMNRRLAWKRHRLEFEGTPLSEIVKELNRYNQQQLVIADPELADERFGGAFPLDKPETFVELLEQNFAVIADRQPGTTVLRRKPKS